MTSPLVVLRAFNWRRFIRPGRLIASAVLLGGLALGGLLALRMLKPAGVVTILPGQALAWDIARAAGRWSEVQLSSGAYLPGDRMLLYSRTSHTDQAVVRSWATIELQPFAERLAALPAGEKFVWVIDYGTAELAQEVLQAPLGSAVDAKQFTFTSSAPTLAVDQLPVPSAPAVAQASAAPAPSAAPVPSVAPVLSTAPIPSIAPAPSVAPAATTDGAAVPLINTDFDGVGDGVIKGWNALSGDWGAHDSIYSQKLATGFDFISMLDLAPQTDYALAAKIRLGEGKGGGGFIYNAPNGTTRNGAQVVDLSDTGGFMRWGRYDENGNYAYSGGAKLDTPINDGQWHALALTTHGATSTIQLDGKAIGTIANSSAGGYVGLTASEMQADFDDVTIAALGPTGSAPAPQATTPAASVPAGAAPTTVDDNFDDGDTKGWQVVSGTWQNIEGAYRQTATNGSDLGSMSQFTGKNYTVSVRVRRLDGDMGAGLFFNSAQRDKKSQSQMINYTQGGKALQWGHFDEGGNFVYDGSAAVPDGNDGQWHTLRVDVKDGKAAFKLDNADVANDVSLTFTSGFVGLLASNSVVAFDDITITAQYEGRP